ncbi:MAG: YqhA family protein, partial [Alphaproteobacteria bacterium]
DMPDWLGKVDFSALKLMLVASIVAISGIHLLKVFMDLNKYTDREIQWMVVIHIVFVVSGVLLALMDKMAMNPILRQGK